MTIVGGFDVHRKQLTFDYMDSETGEVRSGQIRPATRKMLRNWLDERTVPAGMRSSRWRAVPDGGMWSKN